MAKISRVYQQLFGLNGLTTYFRQFGSKNNGLSLASKNPATIQALAAFIQNGWPDAINGSNKAPYLGEMNALHYLIFYQLCYLLQDGIAVWDPTTPYYTGSVVRKDGTAELYSSAIDNNINNALPTQSNNGSWNYINTTSTVPPGAISDFGGSSAPSGWLLCDGTSYATSTYPALFAAIAYGWGGSGANFKVPDLRGRTSIGAGLGSGLTNRVLATSLGEENHILTVPEIPAHTHSYSKNSAVAVFQTPGGTGMDNATSQNTGSTGGGGGHNNMQPSAVVTKIIKI